MRLFIVVEGFTEERVVKDILAPHLAEQLVGVEIEAILMSGLDPAARFMAWGTWRRILSGG